MTFVSRKLRLRVSLGVGLALVLLLAPLNWMQYEVQRRAALRELELLATSASTAVAHSLQDAMLANNRPTIQAIVDGVVQGSEIRDTYLLDSEGMVAASPGGLKNGKVLDRSAETCQVCHRLPAASRPQGITVIDADNQPVFRTMTPIYNRPACYECHSSDERINGVFYMDYSMAGLNARLQQGRRNAFWVSVAIIALCITVLYILLSWLVITPMERVAQGIHRFGHGHRDTRVDVRSRDEVGQLASVFNDMATTIQRQEEEASRLYSALEVQDATRRQLLTRLNSAREEEQRRLARHIHDVLGQLLTGLSLYLKLCKDALPADLVGARELLVKANVLVRDTMDQAHGLVSYLRPTVLDDYGLAPALQEELANRLHPLELTTHLEQEGDLSDLPDDVVTAVFRVAQEAMVNIIRHAQASEVWVHLARTDDGLAVTIDDDGVGLASQQPSANGEPAYKGMGTVGMRERILALDGQLEITQRIPSGTRVSFWLPLAPDGEAA